MRGSFQEQLDALSAEALQLGEDVHATLEFMAKGMENCEEEGVEAARREVGVDRGYKMRGQEIERECLLLQTLQAPVAKDIRLIYCIMNLTNHFVRSGTLAEHICKSLVETRGQDRDQDLSETLAEMARTARNVFRQGLDVFGSRDIESARDLQATDDKVDLLYSEALNLIANPQNSTADGTPEWRMHAALMVHYLERIADHGVDIGGMTVFLITGERIEDAMQQYMNRDLHEDEPEAE